MSSRIQAMSFSIELTKAGRELDQAGRVEPIELKAMAAVVSHSAGEGARRRRRRSDREPVATQVEEMSLRMLALAELPAHVRADSIEVENRLGSDQPVGPGN